MKNFKEFLNESSLSRIKSKSDKGGIATMSASRADKSAKENRARAKQLDKDIKADEGMIYGEMYADWKKRRWDE